MVSIDPQLTLSSKKKKSLKTSLSFLLPSFFIGFLVWLCTPIFDVQPRKLKCSPGIFQHSDALASSTLGTYYFCLQKE